MPKACKGKGKFKDVNGCGELKPLYGHGLCWRCYKEAYFKRKRNKPYKRKKTGELELFMQIWASRKHISEISGVPLYGVNHSLWINQFMHILPKGSFPAFRLNPDNIVLAHPDEHYMFDHQTYKVANEPTWSWVFKKKEELTLEYYER